MVEAVDLFCYPSQPSRRRHGPRGYASYQQYKPWLRDEFQFRCAYCLCRERWFPNGESSFSVDHLKPRSLFPDRLGDYDNLVYACVQCNSAKQDLYPVPDPFSEPYGRHLAVRKDGRIEGLTPVGDELIHVCGLDRPALSEFRARLIRVAKYAAEHSDASAREAFRRWLAYPSNLPRLSTLRPPDGNLRPGGVSACYHELALRHELAETY